MFASANTPPLGDNMQIRWDYTAKHSRIVGCPACGGRGYRGRIGLFELYAPETGLSTSLADDARAKVESFRKAGGIVAAGSDLAAGRLDGRDDERRRTRHRRPFSVPHFFPRGIHATRLHHPITG